MVIKSGVHHTRYDSQIGLVFFRENLMVDTIMSRSHDMDSAQEYNDVALILVIISSSPFAERRSSCKNLLTPPAHAMLNYVLVGDYHTIYY